VSGSSAVSRVQKALDSAHASQGTLNAFTYLDDDRALALAAAIDEAIAAGGDPGPLAGMPVGLKDLIDHEGRTTTAGSAFYRKQATASAPVVTRLEEAGAVIIGRTGLHEFAFGFSSENPHFGPVRNPWDTGTSPGGSSGGSGAAVAAGITPISIGTDTGGSVRVPAALCACFGLKVSHGRIPLDGVFPLALSVDTVGPLADSIDNLSLAYRVMSLDETEEPASTSLRLGIPQPWFDQAPMEDKVARSFETLLDDLRGMGHAVSEVEMPAVLPVAELIHAISGEITEVHAEFRARGLAYGADVARRLDDCAAVTPDQAQAGLEWQRMIRARFAAALKGVDMLITPTSPVTRKVIGNDTIGDRHYRAVLSWFTAIVNHSLHPAIALPLTGSGEPAVSLQAIGSLGSETRLIAFGRSLENAGVVGFTPAPLGVGSA
jgi:aspartyl-tRNA(Asn)/glutamyl-tRNA(Gln) amidotransferase subunit A